MKLFFETSDQARLFLATLPIGFLAAFLFDAVAKTGHLRPVLDVLCLLLCGFALIALTLILKDEGLRMYHLLALVVGASLYLCGFGRVLRLIKRRSQAYQTARGKIKSK